MGYAWTNFEKNNKRLLAVSLFIVIITVAGYHHSIYRISKLHNYYILYACRNKQPPASGLGTASPAYVEARMYAPANASRRQVFIC